MENSLPIASVSLDRAAYYQRFDIPEDNAALDRLFAYLKKTRPKMLEIRQIVAQFYGIQEHELIGRRRLLEIVFARQMFCYLCYRHTRCSMPQIAAKAGLTNHTTVLSAVRKIERLVLSKPLVADDLDLLRLRMAEKVFSRLEGLRC
jgi:chromosomal replication initiator protein